MPICPPEPSEDETLEIVKRLHAGQVDKGGRPYVEHLVAVRDLLGPDATDVERKAALLHDAVEDTDTTEEDLLAMGFRREIVDIVSIVSKKPEDKQRPGETSSEAYFRKIRSIIDSGNLGAMRVKCADNKHNGDPARDQFLPPDLLEGAPQRRSRYKKSAFLLEQAIVARTGPEPRPDAARDHGPRF